MSKQPPSPYAHHAFHCKAPSSVVAAPSSFQPPFLLPTSSPAGASLAIAGQTPLSLSLTTDCPLPSGYTFRWQFLSPDGHAYPVAAAAGRFLTRLSVPAPWPPPPSTAVALMFGVCVQDPSGSALGPMLGNRTVVVQAPACPSAPVCLSASLFTDPPLHLRCSLCEGVPLQAYLRAHVRPHLWKCSEVNAGQLLLLLQTLHGAFAMRLFGRVVAGLCCVNVLSLWLCACDPSPVSNEITCPVNTWCSNRIFFDTQMN